MHSTLFHHIEERINIASAFMLANMPIALSPDEIYEDIIGDPAMAQAFANAVQYLSPSAFKQQKYLTTEAYGIIKCNLRLPPTTKYSTYLMPSTMAQLTHQSKLSQALFLPLRVSSDWSMLLYAFHSLADAIDVQALACIMPWIRELVADWERINPRPLPPYKPVKERRVINQDIDIILSEKPPRRFPRLTEPLNQVCLSGKALFSQWRMLESCTASSEIPPIVVSRQDHIPDWLQIHMSEVLEDWRTEQYEQIKLKKDNHN